MSMLGGRRKSVAGETLTRFVRTPGNERRHRTPTLAPADVTRSLHPKTVARPQDVKKLLVSGHSNIKLGRDVRKGHLRGYWIYQLSLEERATCPTSCRHWRGCYGNQMRLAKRINHRSADFLPRLEAEIADLLGVRGRKGILIRLHALGDFYSVEYVDFWRLMLVKHPRLAIFGYTARHPASDIGDLIYRMKHTFGGRFMIRWSDGGMETDCTVSVSEPQAPAGAFLCPEQTGQSLACATCSACWSTNKNVAFQEH